MGAGRPRNIESPELLLELWNQYKDYIDSNPDLQQVATGKGVFEIQVKKPYLRQGFEAYCFNQGYGNIHQYFSNQRGDFPEFVPVITHIRTEWQTDQLEGSLTGRYKSPNLVARINGIKDSVDDSGTKEVIIRVKHERKGNNNNPTGGASGAGEDTPGSQEV
jgi:hypothetical protein